MTLKSKVEVSEKIPGVVEGVVGSHMQYINPMTGETENVGDGVVTPDEVPPIFDASAAKLLLYAALTIFITSCLTGLVVGYLIGQPPR